MRQGSRIAVGGVGIVIALAAGGSGAVIAPGQASIPVAENRPLGGTVVGSLDSIFLTATTGGTLRSEVVAGDTSNPYGGLTFVYVIVSDATAAQSLHRMTMSGFFDYTTDVSYAAGGAIAPTMVDRDVIGNVVGFDFGASVATAMLPPGASSDPLVIQTDAKSYMTRIATIAGNFPAPVNALGAAAAIEPPIPEPASLLGTVMGAGVFARRRRADVFVGRRRR